MIRHPPLHLILIGAAVLAIGGILESDRPSTAERPRGVLEADAADARWGGLAGLVGVGGSPAHAASTGVSCANLTARPNEERATGMIWISGGTFRMGSDDHYPEEQAVHTVTVDGFWIDRYEVTNAQFARFVEETAYRTIAERGLDPKRYPNLPPDLLRPGSMVFAMPEDVDGMADISQWWRYVPGADWRHPEGPDSSIDGRETHPVVHIAHEDALAYARWLGRDLPTEAQWEFAARGGLDGAAYTWGDTYTPDGRWLANSWQGSFPVEDQVLDGYHGAAPVGCFEPNGYGIFDMAGNVWEWATDWYVPGHTSEPAENPTGPGLMAAGAYATEGSPLRVIKGGSFLCAPNFCGRYRPAARQPHEVDLGASHIGFRTVLNASGPATGGRSES